MMLAMWASISVCSGPLPQAQCQQNIAEKMKILKTWVSPSLLKLLGNVCSCVKLCSKLLIILIMQCILCNETPRINSKKTREAQTGSQRQRVPSVAILGHSSYIPNLIVIDSLTTCELHQMM